MGVRNGSLSCFYHIVEVNEMINTHSLQYLYDYLTFFFVYVEILALII